MSNTMQPGDVRIGRIITGTDDGLPDQMAVMILDENNGVELRLPYFPYSEDGHNPQYSKTETWFFSSEDVLPKTLFFQDHLGVVTLLGARSAGFHMGGGSGCLGRIRVQIAIFNQPHEVNDSYRVEELRSQIDGLREFSSFSPVHFDQEVDEEGRLQPTVRTKPEEVVEWESGRIKYSIRSRVSWSSVQGQSFILDDVEPDIATFCDGGLLPSEHLQAHRSIRALLSFVYGKKISWRAHQIRDKQFPLWMLDGSSTNVEPVEVQFRSTSQEHLNPRPRSGDYLQGLFTLKELGGEGMRRWTELYEDDEMMRAIQPAVEVFNGATNFLDPQLMMLATSLERFGYHHAGRPQSSDGLKQGILRCIQRANLEWPEIALQEELAAAIANANNELKHADRRIYPGYESLIGLTMLAKIVVRAQLFELLEVDDSCRQRFLDGPDVRSVRDFFRENKLRVDKGRLGRE